MALLQLLGELLGFLALLVLFDRKLRRSYNVPKLYLVVAYFLQFLAYSGFDDYLTPFEAIFPHGFVPFMGFLNLVIFGLMALGISIDRELDSWKYNLNREQYRRSFLGYARVYWHISWNIGIVLKAYFLLSTIFLASVEVSILSWAVHTMHGNPECQIVLALSIITALACMVEWYRLPYSLDAGYDNTHNVRPQSEDSL